MIFRKSKPTPNRASPSAALMAPSAASEPSYLGPDTAIEGNIVCGGEIHIDGELRGTVQAHTCLVDVNGHVQGAILAQFVVVRGRVIGPITARQLTITKGAHVEGNVVHQGISIEQGAFVMGSIAHDMSGPEAQPNAGLPQKVEAEILPALPALPLKP